MCISAVASSTGRDTRSPPRRCSSTHGRRKEPSSSKGPLTTDANGRFTYTVEARASHSFRFVYPGTATILPGEDTATLLVKGTSTFKVKPKHVLNGNSVTFSGHVKGRPLPEAGKLIELQVRFASGMADLPHDPQRPRGRLAHPLPLRPHLRRAALPTSGRICPPRPAIRLRPAIAGR